jgi:hypothetical protein
MTPVSGGRRHHLLLCIIRSIVCFAAVVVCGCVSRQEHEENLGQARQLLADLNEIEVKSGNRIRKNSNYDVPGEAVAMMNRLERDLKKLGYKAVWKDDSRFVLVKVPAQN